MPLRIDPSLFVVLGLIGYSDGIPLNEMIFIWVSVAAFCILIHEVGHAMAFLTFGRKPSILLYGFGGVTSAQGGMGPWSSLVTSLAGPIAGFGLGGLILLGGLFGSLQDGSLLYAAWFYGLYACFGFGILNLVPILPLDGGAALAAFLRGVQGPKGEQTARYVSIAVAGTLALVGLRAGQLFLGLFALMFAAQNYQELKRHREEPQREQVRDAYQALFSGRPEAAATGARQVLAGKASADLREIAAETVVWAELARADVGAARAALSLRPERHPTDHRPVSRLPEAAVALAEGAGEPAVAVLASSLDRGESGPPNVLFPLLEQWAVLPDLWSRLGPEGREALQRMHAARE